MDLLTQIEQYLKLHRISATRFGRRAVGDPRFVLDLRMGRRPRRRTVERVQAYLLATRTSGRGPERVVLVSHGSRSAGNNASPAIREGAQ